MKTLADELNAVNAEAGTEEGRLFLTDGNGNELKTAGDFAVLQTNAGPDLHLAGGKLWLQAVKDNTTHRAAFNTETQTWEDPLNKYNSYGDTLNVDLEAAGKDHENVTEQDLKDLGYTPTKAWVSGDLVVFLHNGKLHDVGVS